MRYFLFFCASIITFNGHAISTESVPCWFNNPVTDYHLGFIGVANAFSIKPLGSLKASRKRAVDKLIQHYQFDVSTDDIVDITAEHVTLSNNKKITFSKPHVNSQGMYSYVLLDQSESKQPQQSISHWLSQQCSNSHCNFSVCDPAWLCESTNSSISSVSQMTANPAQQLDKTYENAQELMQYISKSHVDDVTYRVKSTGELQDWHLTQHNSKVEALGDRIQLLNTHSCSAKNYLFARYTYPNINKVTFKPYNQWLSEPNTKSRTGVVGMFNGIMADGRFSSAVKFAIKDGLIELSKVKEITIDNEYKLKYNNGWYSLSKTLESTSTSISAQLMDLKVVEKNDMLIIHAWLLEN